MLMAARRATGRSTTDMVRLRLRLVENLLDGAVEVVEELVAELLVADQQADHLLPEGGVVLGGAEVGGVARARRALDGRLPDRVERLLREPVVGEDVRSPARGAGRAAAALAEPDAGLLVGQELGQLPGLLGVR